MMKKLLFLILLFSVSLSYQAHAFDHLHTKWAKVLDLEVFTKKKQSYVNYAHLKKNPTLLNKYLKELSSVSISSYGKFSKDEKLSFLINAYNAFTLKLIINHYPIDSIKDTGGIFSSPWKKEFFVLLEKKQSLDGIEHDTIRKNFKEPRIHFAVNCASIGCPSLSTRPFIAKTLEKHLSQVTKNFLQNSKKNRFDSQTKTLYFSKIFKWYGDDFKTDDSNFYKFIAPYLTKNKAHQKLISEKKAREIELDYNWGLNEWKH